MNALTYSNSVLKEIEATLSKNSGQPKMTDEQMKDLFQKALNAKKNYLNKADDRKKDREQMQQIYNNAQQMMLEYKEKLSKKK